MIKYFNPQKNHWSFSSLLLVILLGGCVLTNGISVNEDKISEVDSPNLSQPTQKQADEEDLTSVDELTTNIPGLLSKEIAAIGGIHLGDTKQQVYGILGRPDHTALDVDAGEEIWYYTEREVTVYFYKESSEIPSRGVGRIWVGGDSTLKTDSGLGVGDSLIQIQDTYQHINETLEKDGGRRVWINGVNRIAGSDEGYYPTIQFVLESNTIQEMELTNQGVNPGPYDDKPLTLADMKIGHIQIDDPSENILATYGSPDIITRVHAVGDPEWIFEKQGFSIFLEPVWGIRVVSPFAGSTPRGIQIGSTEDEVRKVYPDSIMMNNQIVQNSTDYLYHLVFGMEDGVVESIAMQKNLEFGKF